MKQLQNPMSNKRTFRRKLSRLIAYQMLGLLVSYLLNCFNRGKLARKSLLFSGNITRNFSKTKIWKTILLIHFQNSLPLAKEELCVNKKKQKKEEICMASSCAFLSVCINDSVGFTLLPLPLLVNPPFWKHWRADPNLHWITTVFVRRSLVEPLKCSRLF